MSLLQQQKGSSLGMPRCAYGRVRVDGSTGHGTNIRGQPTERQWSRKSFTAMLRLRGTELSGTTTSSAASAG